MSEHAARSRARSPQPKQTGAARHDEPGGNWLHLQHLFCRVCPGCPRPSSNLPPRKTIQPGDLDLWVRAKGISFTVLHILAVFNSLLQTPFLTILYSMESLWNSLQDFVEDHLIWPKFEHRCNRWSPDEPVLPEISFHSTSYFGHNSLLRTPILMILYSMESLWNDLQDSAEDQLIWSKFEHWCNQW